VICNGTYRKTEQGFTLIELITVIVIIILLVGMLFPALRGAIKKSKVARTESLINRIEGALYRYNSDFRDYPPSTDGGGGTLNDNDCLLNALLSEKGLNAPYESFRDNETASIQGFTCIVDAWKHPLLYCHFTDYVPEWDSKQPWRFEAKKYEFQLISPGPIWDDLNKDSSDLVENTELDDLDEKQIRQIITNW
jgi:prepilin-type N-terminal cleavage/methylation domain-containing protein